MGARGRWRIGAAGCEGWADGGGKSEPRAGLPRLGAANPAGIQKTSCSIMNLYILNLSNAWPHHTILIYKHYSPAMSY